MHHPYITIGYYDTRRFYVLATLNNDIVNGDETLFEKLVAETCRLACETTGESIIAYARQDAPETLTPDPYYPEDWQDVTPAY